MTRWRWLRTARGSGWIECDERGQPLDGAQLRAEPPGRDHGLALALKPGDVVPAQEAIRMATGGTLAGRVERAKAAISSSPTIRARDERQREREAIPFERRLAATKRALAG